MAKTFEGVMPSLLQGVSQQIPRERQPGQLGALQNMLCDPVTGLRRRPPARSVSLTSMPAPADDFLFTAYIERGTDGRHLLINTATGTWQLLSKDTGTLVNSGTSTYLQTSIGATSIQTASINGLTYILNTEKQPVTAVNNTGRIDPSTTGFFYITTAAFEKTWSVTVQSPDLPGGSVTGTTTSGSTENFGINGKPAAVIDRLYTDLIANGVPSANIVKFEQYLFFRGLAGINVTSDSGKTYAVWSNQSRVDLESDLPASLPAAANGCMCRVGKAGSDPAYYRYDYASRSWEEVGAYGSISSISNMPLELAADDNIIVRNFEGRLAGDDDTNKDPAFIENGYITGIAAFQGRLVLLSGASVCMSASGLYQRFYRSTVTSLLDTDRIDIASASAQDSVFRTAIQFNRDLAVFGDSMQAVVPGGNALTPTNASISLTSEFSCDSRVSPIVTGQTVLYANRRNQSYAGLLEFIPSAYTSSQYVSQDATVHLPKYIPGRIMNMDVSSVTNIGFFRYSGERNALLVYEFLWGSDGTKSQAAYHKWVLPATILNMHAQSELMYLFVRGANGNVQALQVDPREGFVAGAAYDYPYVDLPLAVTVSSRSFSLPAALRFSGITVEDIALAYKEDATAAGSELGLSSLDASWNVQTVRGVPDGSYYVGLRTEALAKLTPPMLKDQNDNLVGSGHVRLLRLDVAIRSSGDFDVEVLDTTRDVDTTDEVSGVLMNSKELAPGLPLKADLGNIIIPCRTNSDTTEVTLSTSGTQEMNVLDVSYILRYNQRRQRV
ncbi:tail tubular protein B [Enterobacter phage SDFMU_EhYP]|uniref:Tail tubular protein B n=1 Tax=Enterobacter phage SDFMU_EhYP TaxID=3076128 RepID=A0AA96KS23_9CAUD|nr:tail tubular protein B [Enterobacter phage SDFMU_EhYP]